MAGVDYLAILNECQLFIISQSQWKLFYDRQPQYVARGSLAEWVTTFEAIGWQFEPYFLYGVLEWL